MEYCCGCCYFFTYNLPNLLQFPSLTLSLYNPPETHLKPTTEEQQPDGQPLTRESLALILHMYLEVLLILREVHANHFAHFDVKAQNFILRDVGGDVYSAGGSKGQSSSSVLSSKRLLHLLALSRAPVSLQIVNIINNTNSSGCNNDINNINNNNDINKNINNNGDTTASSHYTNRTNDVVTVTDTRNVGSMTSIGSTVGRSDVKMSGLIFLADFGEAVFLANGGSGGGGGG